MKPLNQNAFGTPCDVSSPACLARYWVLGSFLDCSLSLDPRPLAFSNGDHKRSLPLHQREPQRTHKKESLPQGSIDRCSPSAEPAGLLVFWAYQEEAQILLLLQSGGTGGKERGKR